MLFKDQIPRIEKVQNDSSVPWPLWNLLFLQRFSPRLGSQVLFVFEVVAIILQNFRWCLQRCPRRRSDRGPVVRPSGLHHHLIFPQFLLQGLDKLSFTGSVPTGSKIMAAGAVGVKNVTLELGGKSPLIIFDDSDIKNAVKGALMANFLTQGEVCSNGTRVFVQRGIHDRFVEEFVRQAEKMKAGDPLAEDTTIGGTISEEHAKKVLGYVESAVAEGATLACGGKRVVLEGECAGGWYLSPAILTNCRC